MFNKVCTVAGLQKAVKLGQEDVIFVLEDVDASSHVVKSRALIQKEAMERAEELRKALGKDEEKDEKEVKALVASSTRVSTSTLASNDSLSLAGLLNVLDGVVDTPGRIGKPTQAERKPCVFGTALTC